VLLRTFSRITKEAKPPINQDADSESKSNETESKPESPPEPPLASMAAPLQSLADQGRPVSGRIVTALSKELGFSLQDDATSVVAAYNESRKNGGRGNGRGNRRRPGGGRRDLLQEITAKWPELGDERHWEESPLLRADNQEQLLVELKELPSWKGYEQRQKQNEESAKQAVQHELREVKLRRLISTLESIVFEKNLPLVAAPDIVARYRQMIALEESTLSPVDKK